MSASLSSITSGETQPTPTACSPNIAPNGINVTGLVGQICQVNVPPSEVNITSCCDSGAEVRLQDNCTQWCEHLLPRECPSLPKKCRLPQLGREVELKRPKLLKKVCACSLCSLKYSIKALTEQGTAAGNLGEYQLRIVVLALAATLSILAIL